MTAHADIFLSNDRTLSVYGDARLRLESDVDGSNAAGSEVDDRTRIRTRERVGLKYQPSDILTFDTRLRTGSGQSQQSTHITLADLNGNENGNAVVGLDKWYAEARHGGLSAWAGRNVFPFWSQDEIFWSDNATLLGFAGGYHQDFGTIGSIQINAGHFLLPVGLWDFSGTLTGADLVYEKQFTDITFSFGNGLFLFNPDDGDQANRLKNGNGRREYTIWGLNAKLQKQIQNLPVYTEIDWLKNLQNYSPSDADPFTAANYDQKDGYVLSLGVGDLDKKSHWLAKYNYAHIETLAVNASYAQDDWWRFESSNFKGHQFNIGYAFTDDINLLARFYLVESITTHEADDRLRMDINYKL